MAPAGRKSHLPRKRFYRARAHSNPLSDSQFPVPISPAAIDWSLHFPAFFKPVVSEANSGKLPVRHLHPVGDREEGLSVVLSPFGLGDGGPGTDRGKSACDSTTDEPTFDLQTSDQEAAALENVSVKNPSQVADVRKGQLITGEEVSKVRFADIGCGFGGLLVKLSPMFPDTLMVGMELRDKVSEYVKDRIIALRKENPGQYENIAIIRTNAMKYLQNYFQKGQLQKMFFLFPDPHFKERNHRRRVISIALLAEYAHVMAVGGILYTITDVQDLGEWMKSCLDAHPLFEEVSLQEQELDSVVMNLLKTATEEGQKVERNGGDTYCSVYRRVLSSSAGA